MISYGDDSLGAGIDAAKKWFVRSDLQAMTPVYLTHHLVQETALLRALDSWSMNMISVTGTTIPSLLIPSSLVPMLSSFGARKTAYLSPSLGRCLILSVLSQSYFASGLLYFAYGTPPSVP